MVAVAFDHSQEFLPCPAEAELVAVMAGIPARFLKVEEPHLIRLVQADWLTYAAVEVNHVLAKGLCCLDLLRGHLFRRVYPIRRPESPRYG